MPLDDPRPAWAALDASSLSWACAVRLLRGGVLADGGGAVAQAAKERLLEGNSAVLAVESGEKLERHDRLKRQQKERRERFRELNTVDASSFEQRWAGDACIPSAVCRRLLRCLACASMISSCVDAMCCRGLLGLQLRCVVVV